MGNRIRRIGEIHELRKLKERTNYFNKWAESEKVTFKQFYVYVTSIELSNPLEYLFLKPRAGLIGGG